MQNFNHHNNLTITNNIEQVEIYTNHIYNCHTQHIGTHPQEFSLFVRSFINRDIKVMKPEMILDYIYVTSQLRQLSEQQTAIAYEAMTIYYNELLNVSLHYFAKHTLNDALAQIIRLSNNNKHKLMLLLLLMLRDENLLSNLTINDIQIKNHIGFKDNSLTIYYNNQKHIIFSNELILLYNEYLKELDINNYIFIGRNDQPVSASTITHTCYHLLKHQNMLPKLTLKQALKKNYARPNKIGYVYVVPESINKAISNWFE